MKRIICLLCLSAMLLCAFAPQVYATSTDTEKPALDAPEATMIEDDETETTSDLENTEEDQNGEKFHVKISKDMEEDTTNADEAAQE